MLPVEAEDNKLKNGVDGGAQLPVPPQLTGAPGYDLFIYVKYFTIFISYIFDTKMFTLVLRYLSSEGRG